jgi:hypothetical protein
MSNHRIQVRLQHEFEDLYAKQFYFDIKRGEPVGSGTCISNEDAGLYMMAFDFKEPWATHRRYQVFRERHNILFGRPAATAHRVVMLRLIMDGIELACSNLENQLCAKYVLTKYFMLYVIRLIIDDDPMKDELLSRPEAFVHLPKNRSAFLECMRKIADEIVVDLNYEIARYGIDFDYRDKMRDEEWVKTLANGLRGTRLKLVQQKRMQPIQALWKEALK